MATHVFFDLDDTLVHRARSIARYVDRLIADFQEVDASFERDSLLDLVLELDNGGYLPAGSPHATIREAVCFEIEQRMASGESIDQWTLEQHWMERFPASSVPMPGAAELVHSLQAVGIAPMVVSNGSQSSRESTVRALPFSAQIARVFSSELVGKKKPAREIFALLLDECATDAGNCWFVGDHPINDVHGARAMGMRTIWLEGFHPWPADLEPADHAVVSLLDARDILIND